MAKIQKFTEIEAWKLSRELVREVYTATSLGPFSRDFSLRNQIRRAVVSVPSNIAEGFERGGRREFIQFLSVAKGSTGEVITQLHIAYDLGYISGSDFRCLVHLAEKIGHLIGSFIRYLKSIDRKGTKFSQEPIS